MSIFIAVMIRPLLLLLFLALAGSIAAALDAVIPEGRIKRFLYQDL